jgi:hypothetical protein
VDKNDVNPPLWGGTLIFTLKTRFLAFCDH